MRILLSILSLSISCAFATETYQAKSTIKSVTVYQQGAQINRTGNYTVKQGVTEIIMNGVSPLIDANTLQIKATGNVVILDSKYSVHYPEPAKNESGDIKIPPHIIKEIAQLEDSLFQLSYQISSIQNKMDVLNSQKRIIENNGTIKGQGKVNDSIELLRNALEFYQKEMNSINEALLIQNKAYTLLSRQQNKMQQRLNELKNYRYNSEKNRTKPNNPIHQVIVTVSAEQYATGNLSVSYLVNQAGWTPQYDLRSSNSAKSVDLTYKAQVYQNTGVNWENVKLQLSTNNPYANKTKPTLHPWYLAYYSQPAPAPAQLEKKQLETAFYEDVTERDESVTSTKDLNTRSVSGAAMTADQFMTTIEQLISVEYAIDLPYTIQSNNEKNMVLVKTAELAADYKYYTVPKLDYGVYLIAQITNLDELNLIPGRATIFHDGSYIGNTHINPDIMEDTLNLSLGKSPNISVKRTLLKNASKEKTVGDKIVKTYHYQIQLKNRSKQTIELVVEDQIPIARNPEIEIEVKEISKANLNEVSGILSWNEKLKAYEEETFDLIYTVTYQKSKGINLANR